MNASLSTVEETTPQASNAFPDRTAQPFIKWVGGKRLHHEQFQSLYPDTLYQHRYHTYAEPFLGGGAIFLSLTSHIPFERILLSDINPNLILTYRAVKQDVEALIGILEDYTQRYHGAASDEQAALYQDVRDAFNQPPEDFCYTECSAQSIERAAQFIFLNKCGYGGMFRVNKKGFFNVPWGKHKKPQILDELNLRHVSQLLQHAQLTVAGFREFPIEKMDDGCFVYFDPPYRPLNATSHFTGYYGPGFNDNDQRELAAIFRQLDAQGASLMLSNSDPTNEDPEDDFFDTLYDGFAIRRVSALRKINSNFAKRGRKNELVITNYPARI